MQRHERERQRLERDENAHLHRRGVQQQRRRQRQREVRDLRAERGDRQRRPDPAEVGGQPESAESPSQGTLASVHRRCSSLVAASRSWRTRARARGNAHEDSSSGSETEVRIVPPNPAGSPGGRLACDGEPRPRRPNASAPRASQSSGVNSGSSWVGVQRDCGFRQSKAGRTRCATTAGRHSAIAHVPVVFARRIGVIPANAVTGRASVIRRRQRECRAIARGTTLGRPACAGMTPASRHLRADDDAYFAAFCFATSRS